MSKDPRGGREVSDARRQHQIVLDPAIKGFKVPILLDMNTLRSFAGITNNGQLVLGTIHSATLSTEADITRKLGLKEAMNLDGGSSTGLYLNGRSRTQPRYCHCRSILQLIVDIPLQISHIVSYHERGSGS